LTNRASAHGNRALIGAARLLIWLFLVLSAAPFLPAQLYADRPPTAAASASAEPSDNSAASAATLQDQLRATLRSLSAALTPPAESERDYRRKRFDDLFSSPALWITAIIFLLLVVFWIIYRKELRDLVGNLQTLKIGEYLELARVTVEEMRSFGEDDPEFENPAHQVVGAPLENFFSFLRYPEIKLADSLESPFIAMNWPPLPLLRNLEAALSIQVDRLKASPHFREDHPPNDFNEARKRLFRALVSLGNYYGFVKRDGTERIDLESAQYFLRRAIALRPEAGEKVQLTVGYAQFCLGAINGMLGIELLEQAQQNPQNLAAPALAALRGRGQDLALAGIDLLERASTNGYRVPSQYHVKAYLLYCVGRIEDAAEAWLEAATLARPPSAKMYYNRACALARLARYADSLTALEQAVELVRTRGVGADGFDPRTAARDPLEGAEFEPFRAGDANAVNARSAHNRSFAELIP